MSDPTRNGAAPTAAEAAAAVAAVEQFLRDTLPPAAPAEPAGEPWLRAARLEAVGREPEGIGPWGDPHPW